MVWAKSLFGVLFVLNVATCQLEERCSEGDVRLAGGQTETGLEGRVEICRDGAWRSLLLCGGTLGRNAATVVCRELGFSTEDVITREAFRGGIIPSAFNNVRCNGTEAALTACSMEESRCRRVLATVSCQPNLPQNVGTNTTESTAVVSWQHPSGPITPNAYNITLTYTNNIRHQTLTTTLQVLGNATEARFGLLPQQAYNYCVTAIYGEQTTSSSCDSLMTEQQQQQLTSTAGSSSSTHNSTATVGVLVSIIVVLLFLLLLAVLGLAYPRCIRSKVKDKKYLSKISQFLDEKVYLIHNDACSQHSGTPQPPAAAAAATEGSNGSLTSTTRCTDPALTHDTIHDPPLRSGGGGGGGGGAGGHAKAVHQYDVLEQNAAVGSGKNFYGVGVAQNHYDVQEPQPQLLKPQPQDYTYAVVSKPGKKTSSAPLTYSHLEHK